MTDNLHQSQLAPADNKFHRGNGDDGKHYWLTPPDLYARLNAEFSFDFDPCPYPLPDGFDGFDGLTCEWGRSNYVNPPFGSIMHQGKKKGPTAWVRKAIIEWQKGKRVVLVYPVDKWAVRRLTPLECERLQGFPDNWTAIPIRGKVAADGPRYKACGNSMAVNCMRWLGHRIQMVDDLAKTEAK